MPTNDRPRFLISIGGAAGSGVFAGKGGAAAGRFPFPEEGAERAVFFGEVAGAARVVDHGFDLSAMTRDAGVGHQAINAARIEICNPREVEILEGCPEIVALPQDRQP